MRTNGRKARRHGGWRTHIDDVAPEARQAIAAVLCGVLGIFLVLAAFGRAGVAGTYTHGALRTLFGFGFFLAPLATLLCIFVLMRPREDERVSVAKFVGVGLFVLASLGLLSLYDGAWGGFLGTTLAEPFIRVLGSIAAGVLLGAFVVIGILLTFNKGLTMFRRAGTEAASVEPTILLGGTEVTDVPDTAPSTGATPPAGAAHAAPAGGVLSTADQGVFSVSHFQGPYAPPPLSLLERDRGAARGGDVKASANIIKRTLQNFGIEVEMDEVSIGPTVTRYALKPAEGVRISRILALQNNLELALAAHPVRIEAPIPGRSLVGIEVPNTAKATVGLASLLSSPEYTDSPKPLLVSLGKDIAGMPQFANITQMPHLLIAGATGSGKSVTIHSLITALLFRNSPEQLRLIMVDPKRVELTLWGGIPHLLAPVITDAKRAILALKWVAKEMERRYDILEAEQVRDLASYHSSVYIPARDKGGGVAEEDHLPEPLPYIVIIIDELADIMQTYPREMEAAVVRLAQMSRAVGIHLVLSTQRPSVNVITGLIKANVPARLALQVASQVDSRTILDQVGAEKLLGAGDMLFLSGDMAKPRRIQSAFLSESEVKKVAAYLRKQNADAGEDTIGLSGSAEGARSDTFFSNIPNGEDDDLYEEALRHVQEAGKASTSYLQRRLRIGYSRAARLMDILEERGIIGPADGGRPREVLTRGEHTADTPSEQQPL